MNFIDSTLGPQTESGNKPFYDSTFDSKQCSPLRARVSTLCRTPLSPRRILGGTSGRRPPPLRRSLQLQISPTSPSRRILMPTITTKDGTQIYYKDWGKGQPIAFSHGWPLTADDWDGQMLHFGQLGYRVIAHDRRGHGRSGQTWDGNEMNTYADDLAQLFETLDLKDAIMVGHSTGGGEVARYLGRHGSKRVSKAVLISAVPPLMLKTDKNPEGAPISVFDDLRAQLAANRPQFYRDITLPFYGYNRPGAKISEGIREHWWLQGMV